MRKKGKKSIWRILQGITGIVIIAVIVVLVNLIGNFLFRNFKLDLTEEKLYTLTPGTENIIENIDPDNRVILKFYFSKTEAADIPFLVLYGDRIEDLLREYATRSDGKIKLEVFDPRPDTETEEWALRYGIKAIPTNLGTNIYFGLVISDELDHEEVIPFIDPNREEFLEYDVSKAVYSVVNPRQQKVGVISSLPVSGTVPQNQYLMRMNQGQFQQPWICITELQKLYQVSDLGTEVEEIPADVDVLLVIHPKELSLKTQFAIDQYILGGGHAFIFVDPVCEADLPEEDPNNPYARFTAKRSSNLPELFSVWGISMNTDKVVADKKAATQIGYGQGLTASNVVWLTLAEDNLDRNDQVTGNLEHLLFVDSGRFRIDKKEGVTATPLIFTSKDAAEMAASEVMFGGNPERLLKDYLPGSRPLELAVRIEGNLKTAFPEGVPQAEKAVGEEEEVAGTVKAKDYLKESKGPANLIVVADVDCLSDDFSARSQNFFGQRLVFMINDNISFFVNGVENLTGSSDLISIRSRGKSARPFTKVKEIEARAADTWQDREKELQDKLDQANERLRNLRAPQDKEGKQIFDQAMVNEIKKFRQEKAETMRDLREVRKNLRQDKEKLGNSLFILNTFLVPLLIAVIGIVVWLLRRKGVTYAG